MDDSLTESKTKAKTKSESTLPGKRAKRGNTPATSGFLERHLGSNQTDIEAMLKECAVSSISELIDRTIPSDIRYRGEFQLPLPRSESEALAALKAIASENRTFRSLIGMGYADCVTPPVILRNLFENPGWYTQYTPYQAEISQGRLEALLNFQTMICDLTAMEIANASMLDEATSAAEAMAMAYGVKGSEKRNKFVVSDQCHPQVVSVVRTRARALGIQVVLTDHQQVEPNSEMFGALVSYPATNGLLFDYHGFAEEVHDAGGLVIVAADLLCLTLCVPPGEFGADIVVGNAQRFGVPLGFGGPHAAFFATRNTFRRQMPGRLVGVSKDARGKPAYRLSLQTREQHIRREKATSNICTAQALLANMAVMYAIYHGPHGLKRIAETIHRHAGVLAEGLKAMGFTLLEGAWFDTLCVRVEGSDRAKILENARENGINLRALKEGIGIALDEKTTSLEIESLWKIFNAKTAESLDQEGILPQLPAVLEDHGLRRESGFLQHPIFNSLHTETEMMRYLKRLENRDLSLTASMIPLGSCTMKLNAAAEMYPVTWPEFANIHPFAPGDQIDGYRRLFSDLETWLAEITGLKHVSLQPNAGSQGEYAGLLAIRRYFESNGQSKRDVCLIPQSAHGTNPASAVMAGLKVVVVQCDEGGNIDLADLKRNAADHRERLAALMITYPSTHGVFEEDVREICAVIHEQGGLVYMDGANMNAQVGLCRPAEIGADVCHLNLHKTFCIPHGGGGPGMGPIAVREKLAVFLPGNPVEDGEGAVSSAPWGSSSILPISWMFIAMMGETGLRRSTELAILNANYIAKRLDPYYPILYKGKNGCVAHECIVDLRPFKCVTVEDVAKRLMDYGFHAPTISWPVAGTMMIEPTESESKAELDRFCEAMIAIHAEILEIEAGRMDKHNNLLKNAPHTADQIATDDWDRPYGRRQAAYPKEWLLERKFWPAVGRIDNVYGDRNLVCSCPDVKDYE